MCKYNLLLISRAYFENVSTCAVGGAYEASIWALQWEWAAVLRSTSEQYPEQCVTGPLLRGDISSLKRVLVPRSAWRRFWGPKLAANSRYTWFYPFPRDSGVFLGYLASRSILVSSKWDNNASFMDSAPMHRPLLGKPLQTCVTLHLHPFLAFCGVVVHFPLPARSWFVDPWMSLTLLPSSVFLVNFQDVFSARC